MKTKMTKKKTYKELEESRWDWRMWCIMLGVLFIMALVGGAVSIKSEMYFKTQLQECQDKCQDNVEVWELKANCVRDYSGGIVEYIDYSYTFENHQGYLNFYEAIEGIENCEVIQ